MKTSKVIAVLVFVGVSVVAAQAETYGGVHPATNGRARADVASEAERSAAGTSAYAEAASAGVAPALVAPRDDAMVRKEAVETAHRPNQNVDGKAFVNSVVPSQYSNGSLKIRSSAQAGM